MPTDAGSPFRDPSDPKYRPPVRTRRGSWATEPEPPPLPVTRVRRPGIHPFTVGEAVATAFVVWFRGLVPFTILAVLFALPILITGVVLLAVFPGGMGEGRAWQEGLLLLQAILNQFLAAAVTYVTVDRLRGGRTGILECIRKGLSRILPVLLVSTILSAPFYLIGLTGRLFEGREGEFHPFAMALTLVLIPLAILYIAFSVAVPAAVVERPRALGLAALGRSFELTRGRRWRVFWAHVLVLLCASAGALLTVLLGTLLIGDPTTPEAIYGSERLPWFILGIVMSCLLEPLTAALPAVIYSQLRREKEGVEADEIAEIFG